MAAKQSFMHEEAAESAAVAERQLAELTDDMRRLGQRIRAMDPPVVLTCARGSSDHAATFAKYLIETRAGTPVASFAPSTSSLYATPWRHLGGALFVVISQSGRSPDIVTSARAARQAGAFVVALVNDPDSPLAETAELAIPFLAGREQSVAATKSFLASLLAVVHLVANWTEESDLHRALADAPRVLRAAWELDWSPAVDALSGKSNLFVIGRGLTLGIAQEAALKLKETCALHAEAFSAAEVQHGPMALVGPGFPVLMFPADDEGGEEFEALAGDFLGRGARVIMTGHRSASRPSGALLLPAPAAADHPVLVAIATIQSFYRLADSLSIARGLDPDRPPNLQKVTETR